MRNISEAALDYLTTQTGIEPIIIIEVQWTDTDTGFYSDKKLDSKIIGRLLSVSNLDDALTLTKGSSSQTVTITLSDVDGSMKKIYDNNDLHKRPVSIYQSFLGLPTDLKFLLFDGLISSPIIWKEGDRTLTFDVLSKLEDVETGFSAEEGTFASIPDFLIGKAWPLPFGTCLHIPALCIDPIPTGLALTHNAAEDFRISLQIQILIAQMNQLQGLSKLAFLTAVTMYNQEFGDATSTYWQQQGDQYTSQGNQYLAQMWQIQQDINGLEFQLAGQQNYKQNTMNVANGSAFPQNQILTAILQSANFGGVNIPGIMAGNQFQNDGVIHPSLQGVPFQAQITQVNTAQSFGTDVIQPAGFVWVPSGQLFKLVTALPVRYLAAMLPCTVLNVWAYRNAGNSRILCQVPTDYYTVTIQQIGPYACTVLVLGKPLSYYNLAWEDDLYIDLTSPVGPNTADIIEWIVNQWSFPKMTVDPTSFALVHDQLEAFPSNFCLFDRKNIVQLISEIAYQARCSVWIKNNIFYIRYLPANPAPVDTITENDILLNTLEINCTESESVITKMFVDYKTSYAQDSPNYIVLKNNDKKYGILRDTETWYIYNIPKLVELACTYWMIRKSNTWKILKFRTPMHKLQLESNDQVTIQFTSNWATTGPVVGTIESVVFDSDKFELEFTVWLPVRTGEMEQYNFVYPGLTTTVWAAQTDFVAMPRDFLQPQNNANYTNVTYSFDNLNVYNVAPVNGASDLTGSNINTQTIIMPQVSGVSNVQQPNFQYQFKQYQIPVFKGPQGSITTAPGQVTAGPDGNNLYTCSMFSNGLNAQPVTAKFTNANPAVSISVNDWVVCTISAYSDGSGGLKFSNTILGFAAKSSYPGQVVSGSGSTYMVNIWKQGMSNPSTPVTVTQLQIDPTDAIPPGTSALVIESIGADGKTPAYYMQVPVFLQ